MNPFAKPLAAAAALPRDSRDTLFLLAVVAWVLLPQVAYLPLWASAVAALVLLWRARLAWRADPLPGRWWLLALVAVCTGATLLTHKTILGREAGVTLVIMLLALKTLELRARRDAMVIFFLGFFAMLTNFFVSQSLPVAFAMVVALWGLLTALVQAHMPVGRPPLAAAAGTSARMMLLGAPIMLALFLFFPRMSPLWGVPGDQTRGRSGLAQDMEIGNITSLALDDGVAMRIRFDTPGNAPPPQQDLYFRGPVLSTFDGRRWRPLSTLGANGEYVPRWQPPGPLQVSGTPVRYEATLEPSRRTWLLTLDAAPEKPEGVEAYRSADLQWTALRPVNQLLRYKAVSFTDFRYGPERRTPAMRAFTELPEGFDPRTRALAAELLAQAKADPQSTADGGDATAALVADAMRRLRTGGYTYTLEPGIYGRETADEFWFDRKAGFCEHIASAFVVLMRAADVPARIVTGYQGGDLNAVDGYWTVRQSDAHAWAEVWQAGRGWTRVDPTSAVSPDRIGQLVRLPAPQGAFAGAFGAVIGEGLVQQLRAGWEAVNNRWNQWVLNYTQERQFDLLKRLGFGTPDWQDLARILAVLVAVASIAGAVWAALARRSHDPWLLLLARARRRLERQGLALPPQMPPRAMAAEVQRAFGHDGVAVQAWLLRLEALRYGRADPAAQRGALAALRREFGALAWPAAPAGSAALPSPGA
ncbi:transglutaminase [Xylophilus sp. Leaf220]|nr:transglutaminase [Xylophilus sp. Leaf220]